MRFVGILFLTALIMLAVCFVNSRGRNAKELIGIFIVGTILTFGWAVGIYYAIMMIIRG